jgi:hypothetical protein
MIAFTPIIKKQKYPGNVMVLKKVLLEAATFEILPSEEIADKLFTLPQGEPYTLSLQECGFETSYSILNLGSIQWIGFLYLTLAFIYQITPDCACKVKAIGWIHWNGIVRLLY